ncbi:hypothetical protein [Burkholderia ubonensis]|uniref:hypothetical protein n=1 Tax=Burkholderia ubonensis TaxID=101571 RepID=UPI0012FB2BCE|nr:hypothetical protein [Burkholderia ubonensis]
MARVAVVVLVGVATATPVWSHAGTSPLHTDRAREDSFRSSIPDGSLDGVVDLATAHFVPAKGQSGYLVPIPPRNDFDSVRINIRASHAGKVVGIVRGGIVYWRRSRPVISFGGMEGRGGRIIPVRGYVDVASLASGPSAGRNLKPGESLFVTGKMDRRVPIVIDRAEIPPSDAEDDD